MNNNKTTIGRDAISILGATTLSFTITIICWTLFGIMPDWSKTGTMAIDEVVNATWVSLAMCFCMSIWGYACFSEKFATKASMITRFATFSIVGYGIIAAWVFGSGWCPLEGLGTFSIICAIAFAISGIITYFCSKKTDKELQRKLENFKNN